MTLSLEEAQREISAELRAIEIFLIEKNNAYGNSVSDPIRIFSKLSVLDGLRVRIDDKLSRIARGIDTEKVEEATDIDLIGYLILKRIHERREALKTVN
jgi:hypothetical protein